MAALCSVAPVVAKVPAVSTGKASKSSAMQVWNPTNNKCVPTPTTIIFRDPRTSLTRSSPRGLAPRARSRRDRATPGGRNCLVMASRDFFARAAGVSAVDTRARARFRARLDA